MRMKPTSGCNLTVLQDMSGSRSPVLLMAERGLAFAGDTQQEYTMSTRISSPILTTSDFDAVLFDLDGVITDTAALHIAAWKELFDHYLKARATHEQVHFHSFDPETNYLQYVDGKARDDGITSFLASRGIALPYGSPEDAPEQETICGLGNKKNRIFQALLQTQGITVFASSVAFIHQLRARGLHTAIVSSSRNCAAVLAKAGLTALFDVRIDGVESQRLALPGKPAPDMFLEAVRRLGVEPARAMVVEDSIAGVHAARTGQFGLVIGVARADHRAALRAHGADVVVADLGEITLNDSGTTGSSKTTIAPSVVVRKE